MEQHLRTIQTATLDLERPPARHDQAHADLVQALCQAMAAQVPPADAAEAANMSLSELFNTLRKRSRETVPPPSLIDTTFQRPPEAPQFPWPKERP